MTPLIHYFVIIFSTAVLFRIVLISDFICVYALTVIAVIQGYSVLRCVELKSIIMISFLLFCCS